MSLYFLDSSALVKRYESETGSNWIRALTDVSPLSKKTADYVDSVCIAIYGLNLITMMSGVARFPSSHCAANTYCGGRKTVIR